MLQEEVHLPPAGGLQVRGEEGAALYCLQGGHRHPGRDLGKPRRAGHDPVHPLGLLDRPALGGDGDRGLSLP